MADEMIPLTEERKQEIINERADGLWLVLDEEYPRSHPAPGGFLCGAPLVERLGRRALSVEQSVWGRTDTYDSIYHAIEETEALPGRRVLLFMLENRPDWQVDGHERQRNA